MEDLFFSKLYFVTFYGYIILAYIIGSLGTDKTLCKSRMLSRFNNFWPPKVALCESSVVLLYMIGGSVLMSLAYITGAVVYAYYADKGCDPLASGRISNSNQLTPLFVLEVLNYPGVPGLFMASIFAASLSSISTVQNSIAAIIWADLLKDRCCFKDVSKRKETVILKILVVVCGILGLCSGLLAMFIGGTLYKLIGVLGSAPLSILAGILLAGALCPRVSVVSSVSGGVIVFAMLAWVCSGAIGIPTTTPPLPTLTHNCSVGVNDTNTGDWIQRQSHITTHEAVRVLSNNITESPDSGQSGFSVQWFYEVSYFTYVVFGVTATMVLSMLFSLFPCCRHPRRVPNKYLFPIVRCCRDSDDDFDDSFEYTSTHKPMYHQVEVIRSSIDDLVAAGKNT